MSKEAIDSLLDLVGYIADLTDQLDADTCEAAPPEQPADDAQPTEPGELP